MPKNPTWNYPVDAETLLILAWLSTLNLEALLHVQQQAYPYKRPDDLLKQIMRGKLDEALTCFQSDPVYGPALQRLVEYRIALVDLQCVQWAVSLETLIEPSNGLFFSDHPCRSIDPGQQKDKPMNETETFWEGVTQHPRAASCLSHMSWSWQSNVCLGACSLRSFFPACSRMMLRHRETPFFIGELLSISLQHVDWHAIAARVLCIDPPSCQCWFVLL